MVVAGLLGGALAGCVPPGGAGLTDAIAGGLATVVVTAGDADPDGDGLSTFTERNGYSVDAAGNVTPGWVKGQAFVNLPAMGANPLHKDLFVHVDYMNESWKVPEASGMNVVRQAFANSPLTNPDGRTGITLHVDQGPDSVMNPRTGQTWGSLSRAGLIPLEADTDLRTDMVRYQSQTPSGRPSGYASSGRGHAFRYAVMAHSLDGTNAIGQAGGIPSSVFAVALGQDPYAGGELDVRTTTFMHELGHTINLHHGGAEDLPNNRPNYLSVMSYAYSNFGLPRTSDLRAVLDFSRSTWNIDENALDETVVIPDASYFPVATDPVTGFLYRLGQSGGRVDWNDDASLSGTHAVDVTGDGDLEALSGHTDWVVGTGAGQIRFAAGTVGASNISDNVSGVRSAGFRPAPPCPPPVGLAPENGAVSANAVAPNPVAAITADKIAGVAPLTVSFNGAASTDPQGDISTYDWDFGDGNSALGVSVQHTYTTPGVYQVELQLVDGASKLNKLVTTQRIEVVAANTGPIASFHADASSADPLRTADFDGRSSVDDDGTITSWEWDFGDGTTATGATPSHTYAALGDYAIKLKVTDNAGSTAEASATLSVTTGNSIKVWAEWAQAFLPLRIDQSSARRTEAGTAIAVRLVGWNAHDQQVVIRYLAKKKVTHKGRTSVVRYWKKIGTTTSRFDGTVSVTLRPRLKTGAAVRISAVGTNKVVSVVK